MPQILFDDAKMLRTPAARDAAEKMKATADSIEADILRIARASGKPELVKQLHDARKLFAKTYDIERSIIPGTGDISASKIGALLDPRKRKVLTGELKIIGEFSKAFPKYSRNAVTTPNPGASGTDALTTAMLSTIGLSGQHSSAALTGLLPMLRSPLRGLALSAPMQNRLVAPPAPLGDTVLQSLLAGRMAANQ